jgi:uncharacterized protein YodC (DUF2158 family)
MEDEQEEAVMIGRWMISRTGGPALYIEEIVSDRVVGCSWMDPMGQHKAGQFDVESLEPLDARPVDPAPMALVSRPNSSALDALRRLTARLRAAANGAVPTQ